MTAMKSLICVVALLVTPGCGLRIGASPSDEAESWDSPSFGKQLLVMVLLTGGNRSVNQLNFKDGSFQRTYVGEIDSLDLFDNWFQFFPKQQLSHLNVLCADSKCVDHMKSKYNSTVHFTTVKGNLSKVPIRPEMWKHRLENVAYLLGTNRSVLVSDIDAMWLKNPIPYLAKTQGDVVALRDEESWHAINTGFMLYRPSSRRQVQEKLKMYHAYKDDQQLARAAFTSQMSIQWAERDDGSSVAVNVDTRSQAVLLPSHLFTRERHHDVPGCRPNRVMHQFRTDSALCLDKKVIVAHSLGEVFRAKMATPHGYLWRLP